MADIEQTSSRTAEMTARLIRRGWMTDFAPGEKGKFFRVVVNISTLEGSIDALFRAFEEVGKEVVGEGR
jgi:glutamate decarboxylase